MATGQTGVYGGASDGRREHRNKVMRAYANEEMAANIRDKLATLEEIKLKAHEDAEAEALKHRDALREKLRKEQEEAARARKVLVSGDIRGHFAKLFGTVEAQSSKVGAFDVLFCAGGILPDLAADGTGQSSGSNMAPYLSGDARVPVETYFVDADAALVQASPRGRKICDNMFFLGGYGVRDLCGLRVAYLSGRYDPDVYDNFDVDFIGGSFTARAIAELQRLVLEDKRHRGIDLLLTCGWPAGLEQRLDDAAHRPAELEDGRSWLLACAPPLAELCLAVEPRYHIFSGADLFYQRPPFQTPLREHMCRCIGLGAVGSASKQRKWLHALSLAPMAHMKKADLKQLPSNATPCPFLAQNGQKRAATDMSNLDSQAAKRPARDSNATEGAQNGTEDGTDEDRAFAEQTLVALLAGDGSAYRSSIGKLQTTKLYIPLVSAQKVQQAEKVTKAEPAKVTAGSIGIGAVAGGKVVQEEAAKASIHDKFLAAEQALGEVEKNLAEEEVKRKEAAELWLASPPGESVVRYTFKEKESLGLRLSRDVPPWILEVRDGSLGAKKAPRVPVGGVVLAINGYEIQSQEDPIVAKSLPVRPVVLDIQWPKDQGKPRVNRA